MTLIELVVTILVIGIMAGVAATIMVPAYEAYFATGRRAQLADEADTALRRMVRDVRLSVPNSPRVTVVGTDQFLEFLATKNGGRYRSEYDSNSGTSEDPLRFHDVDDGFDTLGTLPAGPDQGVQPDDFVVIHNLGIPGADAYEVGAANPNIARIATFGAGAIAGDNRITFSVPTRFPLESPGRRFFVISGPVTYACVGGQLQRWSGYAIQAAQPTTLPAGGTQTVLAEHVSACEITYTNNLTQLARGLVSIRLALTRANETVVLFHQTHVDNVP